ncbi:MAG: cation:proton antiporter [Pseudomonadales bacterium]
MDFEWLAISFDDVTWIFLAFVFGFLSRIAGLPPLVGFLAAGFLLNAYGVTDGALFQKLADIGITLLLFTVGLKINMRTLARPQVWAVTGLHMSILVAFFGLAIYALALANISFFAGLNLQASLLIAFALSFSSTVFVVKVLEERGEMTSLHGRIAVGILIMQDVAAVVFLVLSTGKVPSIWALSLLLLIPLRPALFQLLKRIGHGELLVLFGFLLAMGGAQVFELLGLKGDLGALVLGVLIASHAKAEELSKAMLGFKDLFLLGFFLSIGLSNQLTLDTFWFAVIITPLMFFKSALFFALLTRFKLRARTSLLTTLNLSNFSEFGLIVIAIGVGNGWLDSDWLTIIAIALAMSFVIAAALNSMSHQLYVLNRSRWMSFQRDQLIADDQLLDLGGATIAVIGMGGVGSGAYDTMYQRYGNTVVGVDVDPITVGNQQAIGRSVLRGDPSDTDFWDRIQASHTIEVVMLCLPKVNTTLAILDRLSDVSFSGQVAAIARYPDEVCALKGAGANTVFNIYTEAGAGFASHVENKILNDRE